jgi:hypothetical protein
MGLKNYFKTARGPEQPSQTPTEAPTPSYRHGEGVESSSSARFTRSEVSLTPSARSSAFVDEIKHEVMVNYLYQQQCSHLWLNDDRGELEGVLIRKNRNQYMTCPPALADSQLAAACAALNCQVAMTVNSRVIKTFLQWSPDAVDVPLTNGLRIQLLPTIDDLFKARKHQFAAFIASEAILVVWDDEALHLVQRAKTIESELMKLVWGAGESENDEDEAKKGSRITVAEIDEESGEFISEKRATHLLNSILVMFTMLLICGTLGAAFREIAIETSVDHNMIRLAFLALVPVQIFFTLVRLLLFQTRQD